MLPLLVDFWRVQAQGIHLCRLVYLSEEEFEFLELKRVEFLRRLSYFGERGSKGGKVGKKEALGGGERSGTGRGDLKTGRDRHTLCYEPTNISATRDSLYWSWRRVSEYWRDFSDEEDGKRKGVLRIDPGLRKR